MAEYFGASPTRIEMMSEGYGIAQYDDDKNLNVVFYTKSMYNEAKSRASGAPIHEDRVYIKMHRAGEATINCIDRPATQDDQNKFRRQWGNYISNRTQVPEGTPIELLFPNSPAAADNLKTRGVFTIQQLASLSQIAIDSIGMGGQEYVNRAKKYIQSAQDGSQVLGLIEDNKKKDLLIARLEQNMALMRQQIDKLMQERGQYLPSAQMNPITPPSYDVQSERINAKHLSGEIAAGKVFDPLKTVTLDKMVTPDGGLLAPTVTPEVAKDLLEGLQSS